MSLPHLDCTTPDRRIEICNKYIVHADDCIVLYGDQTVRSDANNRIIADRFYQFSCQDPTTGQDYVIRCGSGAARHLCALINEPLPVSMNPFVQEHEPGEDHGAIRNSNSRSQWNPLRRQLYKAVQLFITRYQNSLSPGTKIFSILHSLTDERYLHVAPKNFIYKSFASVVSRFNTNMPQIVQELEEFGELHHFDFEELSAEMERLCPEDPNIFRET